jgi:hypothetical protein
VWRLGKREECAGIYVHGIISQWGGAKVIGLDSEENRSITFPEQQILPVDEIITYCGTQPDGASRVGAFFVVNVEG